MMAWIVPQKKIDEEDDFMDSSAKKVDEQANLEAGSGATCGGNSKGAPCNFPFEYDGKEYSACITDNHEESWCYTDTDGHWGNCNCEENQDQNDPAPQDVINNDAEDDVGGTEKDVAMHSAPHESENEVEND